MLLNTKTQKLRSAIFDKGEYGVKFLFYAIYYSIKNKDFVLLRLRCDYMEIVS